MLKSSIESHTTIDKCFEFSIHPHLAMEVDYDDVNHPEVDAAVSVLKDIVDKYWDEDLFKQRYKEEILKIWNKNEYNLQSDYESLEKYLSDYGF